MKTTIIKYTKRFLFTAVIGTVILVTFFSQYDRSIHEIQQTAESKEAQINKYIDLSNGFIDLVTIYANDFVENTANADSDFYGSLYYDLSSDSYSLDTLAGTEFQEFSGNLTGIGGIPHLGSYRNEINLALHLNKDFCSIYNKIPEAAWIYYTSENQFINIYPWVSSTDFSFNSDLLTEKFYTYASPENNPLRESVWTPVYLDHAGKGLMVTLSSPVYNVDTFLGVISIDLTNSQLSEILQCTYDAYLVDETDSVIATTLDITFGEEAIKYGSLLNIPNDDFNAIKNINKNEIQRFENYFVYSAAFNNAPWKMYFLVPVWSVVGKAAIYTLPIFFICLLFILTLIEIEKRKETEMQLKNSVYELTSYQTLLENAAKYDFLTSTVNRRGLIDIFNKDINQNEENQHHVIFIMGDIDYFKQFNDQYGHAAGDKVLKEIALIMQKNIISHDVVCRWGGEEFIIMLLNRTCTEAIQIAEKIRNEIASTVIPWEHSVTLQATMTFGIVEHHKNDEIDVSISKADAAMYSGKQKGRNRVVCCCQAESPV